MMSDGRERAWRARKADAGTLLARRLRQSVIYRGMRRLGLWDWMDELVELLATERGHEADARPARDRLRAIAVDLTTLRPPGERGGSNLLAPGWLEQMSLAWPDVQFTVATTIPDVLASHDQLGSNVRVVGSAREAASGADVLFCPLTHVPQGIDMQVPIVSVVYDLQHEAYPQFFPLEVLEARIHELRRAFLFSESIVCISEAARRSVIEAGLAEGEAVTAIPVRFREEALRSPDPAELPFGLEPETYLLYPANFWEHKNHELLLTALGIYFHAHPDSALRCVCSGFRNGWTAELEETARRMGLGDRVLFPGYLERERLLGLMAGAKALIFPSLYEGFGMPVAEAIVMGRPVLAARIPAIEEAAGDAAYYFDPRNPHAVAAAIETLEADPACLARLRERAAARRSVLCDVEGAMSRFRAVFEQAAGVLAGGETS